METENVGLETDLEPKNREIRETKYHKSMKEEGKILLTLLSYKIRYKEAFITFTTCKQ